jgi:hypothetical protein
VRYEVETRAPQPYQRCYCSICRKTGGSGYMINLLADHETMKVEGREHLRVYRARVSNLAVELGEPTQSKHARYFCSSCGSHLWARHDDWPRLCHPVASSVDDPLPAPESWVHMMLGSKADWVPVETHPGDERFDAYPAQSLWDWHETRGLLVD